MSSMERRKNDWKKRFGKKMQREAHEGQPASWAVPEVMGVALGTCPNRRESGFLEENRSEHSIGQRKQKR